MRSDDGRERAIAERAYALYLARGSHPGDALGDWLQAERELDEAQQAAPSDPAPVELRSIAPRADDTRPGRNKRPRAARMS